MTIDKARLCEDCAPPGYPTDKTRCAPCPRRDHPIDQQAAQPADATEIETRLREFAAVLRYDPLYQSYKSYADALTPAADTIAAMRAENEDAREEIKDGEGIIQGLVADLKSSNATIAAQAKRIEALERATEVWSLIDGLRETEGSSITLFCDNPDFNGQPNAKVICCGEFTNWTDKEFTGETILGALRSAALAEKEKPSA